MGKKGRSDPNLFGGYNHYDANGKKIGSSQIGFLGRYVEYDAKGKRIGSTDPGFFGSYHHRDANGQKTGSTQPDFFWGYRHYDAKHTPVGRSNPGFFGSYHHTDSQGCYVATCVYGSYDCPQVWTLRRFRDFVLAKSRPGRAFIRAYYVVSPGLVARFGKTDWFRRGWGRLLDPLVARLNAQGMADTPYEDRDWRGEQ